MAVGSTQYPGAIDTTTTLLDAVNNVQSTLAASLSSTATSLTLASASAFPSAGVVSIESEIIHYSGKSGNNLTGLTRGAEGTTAASHASGRVVRMAITASYHDALRSAILALQTKVGVGESTPATAKVLGYTEGIGSTWVTASEIPGVSVNTGSDPNAVKTNTSSAQALLGSLDADKPTKTAAQIGALTAGRKGRDIFQTDSLLGVKRDFGADIGFRHATPYYYAYELGFIPTASDSTTRTANTAAWDAFIAALPASGGRIQFPEGVFYFATTLESDKPVLVEGSGSAFVSGTLNQGTTLFFESGQTGLKFVAGANGSAVRNLMLKVRGGYVGRTTGDGIYSDVTVHIHHVSIEDFGRDGVFLYGTLPALSDLSTLYRVDAYNVGRDGFHYDGGDDTNIILTSLCNATHSGRHGFYNAGFSNHFENVHVSASDDDNIVSATTSGAITANASPQNVTLSNVTNITVGMRLVVDTGSTKEYVTVTALPGSSQITAVFSQNHSGGVAVKEMAHDYMEDGGSNVWILPYAEASGSERFHLGSNSSFCTVLSGTFGVPIIDPLGPGLLNTHNINERGHWRDVRLKDTSDRSDGRNYSLISRYIEYPGQFLIANTTDNKTVLSYNPDGEKVYVPNFFVTGVTGVSGTPQTLTGAGAVNLTTGITYLVTTGANALTLADGAQGQIKTIRMKTDGGDGTLTPTNAEGFTTITFTAVGQTVTLQFLDGKWNVIGHFGVTIA